MTRSACHLTLGRAAPHPSERRSAPRPDPRMVALAVAERRAHPMARKALVLGDRTNTDSLQPSPLAVSPVLSPVGRCAREAAEAATPQPSRGAAVAPHSPEDCPWKENWTDEVFSADISLPLGFDLASFTAAEHSRTERVEVDTGTVITLEPAGVNRSTGSHSSSGSMSIVICGSNERNVDEARARIEDILSSSQLDESSILLQDDADSVVELSSKLFEIELQLLQQEEEQSLRLAKELQQQEHRIELSFQQNERAGALLAAQLHDEEKAQAKMRQESVQLSKAFFDDLPMGFVRCPGCSVPIETLADNSVSTLGPLQELPRGATLDTASAEKHKGCNRFRCSQCSTEFCSGCSVSPYHYGFDCEGWTAHMTSARCRFCGDIAVSDGCCSNEECQRYLTMVCKTPLSCGHLSCGVEGEHLPCLETECTLSTDITVTADDWCMICYTAPLRGAPCILLGCKHVFHAECLKARVVNGRPGARLSFNFLDCPACNVRIDPDKTPYLKDMMQPHLTIEQEVKRKATQRLRESAAIVELQKTGKAQADEEERISALAMRRFNYYPCSRCDNVFFGGEAQCGERGDSLHNDDYRDDSHEDYNADELICGACSSTGETTCAKHGTEFIEYKCRFCCKAGNVATFFCGGSTHFCSECHKKGWGATAKPCDPATCMFGSKHPDGATNGKDEYSLGCGLCRNYKDR